MNRNQVKVVFATFVVLAAGFAALSATASTEAKATVPAAIEEAGEEVRSTMTMKEVVSVTNVPREYIVRYLNLPGCVGTDNNKPAHEWLSKHGLSIVDLREAVDRYRSGHRF